MIIIHFDCNYDDYDHYGLSNNVECTHPCSICCSIAVVYDENYNDYDGILYYVECACASVFL